MNSVNLSDPGDVAAYLASLPPLPPELELPPPALAPLVPVRRSPIELAELSEKLAKLFIIIPKDDLEDDLAKSPLTSPAASDVETEPGSPLWMPSETIDERNYSVEVSRKKKLDPAAERLPQGREDVAWEEDLDFLSQVLNLSGKERDALS